MSCIWGDAEKKKEKKRELYLGWASGARDTQEAQI